MITLLATLAAISGGGLVGLLIQLVVIGLIFWLLTWAIGYIGLPDPFAKFAKAIIVIIAVVMLINALRSLTGSGGFIDF